MPHESFHFRLHETTIADGPKIDFMRNIGLNKHLFPSAFPSPPSEASELNVYSNKIDIYDLIKSSEEECSRAS